MLTATQQLYASSCSDTIPTSALKNALIVADSLDRMVRENAALKNIDSISTKIVDTLIKSIKIKEKQLQLALGSLKDCLTINEVLAVKNEINSKAAKRELFWKRFFQFTTVAALTVAAIK